MILKIQRALEKIMAAPLRGANVGASFRNSQPLRERDQRDTSMWRPWGFA
jgi:hypothetical protein